MSPARGARAARFVVPRALPPAAALELPFEACSVYVENPSGVWYDVAGFTVPPWTWGLINRLDVPAPAIAVQLLASPAALVSEDHGGALLVVAYADALLPSVGRSLHPPPRNVVRVAIGARVTEAQAVVSLAVAAPTTRVVPMLLQSGSWGANIRGQIVCTWQHELTPGVGWATFARQVLSPESPQASPIDVSWLTSIGKNCEISVNLMGEAGAGAADVYAELMFYRALP